MTALRSLAAFALVAAGTLIGLFSLFLLRYDGDTDGGNTYVEIGGRHIDAQLVGAAGLATTAGLFLAAWLWVRRSR